MRSVSILKLIRAVGTRSLMLAWWPCYNAARAGRNQHSASAVLAQVLTGAVGGFSFARFISGILRE